MPSLKRLRRNKNQTETETKQKQKQSREKKPIHEESFHKKETGLRGVSSKQQKSSQKRRHPNRTNLETECIRTKRRKTQAEDCQTRT